MGEIVRADEMIVCPRGTGSGEPILVDLRKILAAEARCIEVQCVTPVKSGELLAVFAESWRNLSENVAILEYEKNEAARKLKLIRATLLLDKVPEILKQKGLASSRSPAGSEDLREAIICQDPEYQEAEERHDYLCAVIKFLDVKVKAFGMAYQSVKKLLDNGGFNFNNGDLSGDSGNRQPGEISAHERPPVIPREREESPEVDEAYPEGFCPPRF